MFFRPTALHDHTALQLVKKGLLDWPGGRVSCSSGGSQGGQPGRGV